MIRLVRVGAQVSPGQDEFAFWDTVTDCFLTFQDEQLFSSISHLEEHAPDPLSYAFFMFHRALNMAMSQEPALPLVTPEDEDV